MRIQENFKERLAGTTRAIASLETQVAAIAFMADAIGERLRSGGTLYTCGNGGSAAEAMHFSEELIGRYRGDERGALAAICLNADPTALTCIANDFGFENVFSRQCEALLTEKDALVVLSPSGASENIVAALHAARERGAMTVGLLGATGGACLELCDHAIVIPGEDSAHTQEAHLVVVHLVCEALE